VCVMCCVCVVIEDDNRARIECDCSNLENREGRHKYLVDIVFHSVYYLLSCGRPAGTRLDDMLITIPTVVFDARIEQLCFFCYRFQVAVRGIWTRGVNAVHSCIQ